MHKHRGPRYRITSVPVWPVYEVIVRLGRDVGQPHPRREDDALDGLPVGVAPEEGLRGAAAAHCQPVGTPSRSHFNFQINNCAFTCS